MKYTHIIPIIVALVTLNCSRNGALVENEEYSFFVAGHVYGYPGESKNYIGVHPPFKENFDIIKDNDTIKFGVFTGDIVENGKYEDEWDEVDADIKYLNKPVHFAAGNHDVDFGLISNRRKIFTRRYGSTYYSFDYNKDLYIVLDPNMDKWNISGEQLVWLESVLRGDVDEVNNVFVFFHELLWWGEDEKYKNFGPNNDGGRAEKINFWPTIYPAFEKLKKPVYMFAGDTGVREQGYMYYKNENSNIALIASGMGGSKQDNFIIVSIGEDKSVKFRLIALNGDNPNALGKLEDYKLP